MSWKLRNEIRSLQNCNERNRDAGKLHGATNDVGAAINAEFFRTALPPERLTELNACLPSRIEFDRAVRRQG
jgi:hypothetical protein